MVNNVGFSLEGVTSERPFRNYYEERNGTVARKIAEHLGVPYTGEVEGLIADTLYLVPPRTLDRNQRRLLQRDEENIYGAALDSLDHVGKAILHPTVSQMQPVFYSYDFANQVTQQGLVLPGYTAFSAIDALSAYRSDLPYGYRLKPPHLSDGHGQIAIEDEQHLQSLLEQMDDAFLREHGVVMEANLNDPQTISVGFARIGRDTYSFIAHQKDDRVLEDGIERSRYLGANITAVRGNLDDLRLVAPHKDREAVEKSAAFYNAYSHFNPLATRLSFDCLSGYDNRGERYSGITDITGRLGGTCPAIMEAMRYFSQHPQERNVSAQVTLNYDPQDIKEVEIGAETYVNQPSLRITARVNHLEENI
jgi:hypothetical protein